MAEVMGKKKVTKSGAEWRAALKFELNAAPAA
jgi:hypothetical protein